MPKAKDAILTPLDDSAVWTLIGSAWTAPPRPLRITEITYSFSTKMNLENYGGQRFESIDLFMALKAQVDEGDNLDEIYEAVKTIVRDKVRADKAEIVAKLKERSQKNITQPRNGGY